MRRMWAAFVAEDLSNIANAKPSPLAGEGREGGSGRRGAGCRAYRAVGEVPRSIGRVRGAPPPYPPPRGGRVRTAFLASLVFVFTALAVPAHAVQPDEILPDPALEQRARELSAELRCMVCQNQSIDDSNAPLARDLRLLVRERLVAGDSDEEVLSFLVDRYGEFVLLKPSFSGHTLLLWLAAPAVLIAGGLIAWGVVGRNRRRPEAAPLSAEEEAELARLRGEAPAPETPAR